MMRKAMIVVGVALCVAALMPLQANAATEAEKQTAINNALVHLCTLQQGDGSWNYWGGSFNQAATGAVVLAFQGQGFQAGNDVIINAVNYGDVLGKALDYILSGTAQQSTAGKPASDTHGANGYGVYWPAGGEDIYTSSLCTLALATSGLPSRAVTTGSENGRTIKDVVGDAVDYFALAQVTAAQAWNPGYVGGWRYVYPSSDADGSTSQWPVIAMEAAANRMGVTAPAFVATELTNWIAFDQNADGGADYDGTWGSNVARTGGLLVEMAYAGYGLGDANVQAALGYINTNWQTTASFWDGNFGQPYAMWSVYKGLQGMIGLDVTSSQYITNLHADPGDVDNPNHGWNWWEDYCNYLVNTQNGDGSWTGGDYWTDPLSTAWYTNILLATELVGPTVPEPITCGALVLGLGGLFGYLRRRRVA